MGRETTLTKAGTVLYEYAKRMLALRKEALNGLCEFSEGIQGDLSIGASTTPGEYILPRLLGEFRSIHPNLTISLRVADTKEIVQDVLQGSVEFGMTGAKLKHPSLRYDLFEEDEIIVIGPPSTPPSKRKVTIEQTVREPWVMREEGSGTKMAVEKALNKRGKTLKQFCQTIEMGSTASLKEAVKAGLGFAFVSRKAVEDELNQDLLSELQIEGMDSIRRQIYIVLHRGRAPSPMGIKFLRFLRKRKELE